MSNSDAEIRFAGFVMRTLNLQLIHGTGALVPQCVPPTKRCGPVSVVLLAWLRPEEGPDDERRQVFLRALDELKEQYERNPERFGG